MRLWSCCCFFLCCTAVKAADEYLGVCFIELDSCEFDKAIEAIVLPVYEGVHYDKLKVNTSFFIMEGGNIVGEGIVKEICSYCSYNEFLRKARRAE